MRALPLTNSQNLIWLGQSMAPDSPLYNMAWRFDIEGNVDSDRLGAAWREVCNKTDSLRLSFDMRGAEPVQVVSPEVADLDIVDLQDDAKAKALVDDAIAEDIARPFDLTKTAHRVRLFKLRPDHCVLYLNQHHISTDAGSGQIIWRRLVQAYKGEELGAVPQFADYVAKETSEDAREKADNLRAGWTDKFRDSASAQQIYGRKADHQKTASRHKDVDLGTTRLKRLRALALSPEFRSFSAEMSVFSLLATAFGAFLSRVKDQQTVVIGAPAHSRRTPEERDTAGLFIEMLPLKVGVEQGDSLETLHEKVRLECYDWLKNAAPGVVSPALFASNSAALNYMPVVFDLFEGFERQVQWLPVGAHDSNQDLRLHVFDFNGTGQPVFRFEGKAELFDAAQLDAMVAQFLTFLDGVIAAPKAALAGVRLLADNSGDASMLLGATTDEPESVVSRFRKLAECNPDAVAIVDGECSLSYGALEAMAGRIAHNLKARGLQRGGGVAIHACRSADLVAAMLGVWMAGGYFAPIAADTPDDRVQAILGQLDPVLVVADGRTIYAHGGDARVALLGDLASGSDAYTGDEAEVAYVLFTSGSTGTPKGVEVGGAAFARYIDWAARSYGPAGAKTYALFSSIGFDLTMTSIFTPLVTGGCVRVYSDPISGADLSVMDVFSDDAVDVVKLTPAHLNLALQQPKQLVRISTLILGGENLTREICIRAQDAFGPELRIANEYGPTEAVVGCMVHWFDRDVDLGASVPIGCAGDDVCLGVVDPSGNLVPKGVAGELAIGGARLANGYFGAANQTAERFPTGRVWPDRRTYMTGDLVRLHGDNVMEYLGRADEQVKISGVRIEPAEVEAALLACKGVTAAAVVPFDPANDLDQRTCVTCGLSGTHPDSHIDATGQCKICRDFALIKDKASVYFETPGALRDKLTNAKARRRGKYDAIMLLSGGKDSAYALYRLAELTRDVLVVTLDNGYISDGAKANVRRMCDDLNLEHRFVTTPAMNAIFRDSLDRFSNVCQGCFKTIYALAIQIARNEGIPAIVTGLSRGQFFETRLTVDLFAQTQPSGREIDGVVGEARKAYHDVDDAVARELNTASFIDDQTLADIEFIDIYRYLDVPVSEIYDFLRKNAPWVRPEDTGRSTNCLINDVGIFVHKKREGFHNYALPYSWDVRLGHKTRLEANAELDDDLDEAKVTQILDEIGYDREIKPRMGPSLVAYVVTDNGVSEAELISQLRQTLPREMVPSQVISVPYVPLTPNGKLDRAKLPKPTLRQAQVASEVAEAAATEAESTLAAIYAEVIGLESVDVTRNIYDLGGDSIAAIQIAMRANELGLPLKPNSVFEHQTVRLLAASMEGPVQTNVLDLDDDAPLLELDDAEQEALVQAGLGAGRAQTP